MDVEATLVPQRISIAMGGAGMFDMGLRFLGTACEGPVLRRFLSRLKPLLRGELPAQPYAVGAILIAIGNAESWSRGEDFGSRM